jgi:DNA-binding winged helix-turn-helix (wHTH) protein
VKDDRIGIGPRRLDVGGRLLSGERGETELSPLACRFLVSLSRKPGEIVARNTLIEELWAGNFLVGDPGLNRLVSETRRAIAKVQEARLIETVQKTGYRLTVESITRTVPEIPRVDATDRASWKRWALIFATVIIVTLALHWLIDSLTGLVWTLRTHD